MKILKLQFKNIHSLQGEHEIDFLKEPLSKNQLFVITGSTGSGKSTLLDVITLALFNRIPRNDTAKISQNFIETNGSILTRGQKNAEAAITYQCKKGVFKSVWSISTGEKNNLRNYEMELFDLSSGKMIENKRSMVPEKNEQLIGLKYEQFVKSVLLAQGAFAEFLKADKNQRSELLEKITGTEIYRRLGIRAFEKYRSFDTELKLLSEQKLREEQKLQQFESLENITQKLQSVTLSMDQIQEGIISVTTQIEHQKQLEREEKELTLYQEQVHHVEAHLHQFLENEGKRLKQHQTIAHLEEPLKHWKKLQIHIKEKKDLLQAIEEKQLSIAHKKEQLQQDITTFTKKTFDFNNYENVLHLFEKEVIELNNLLINISDRYKSVEAEVKNVLSLLDIHFSINKIAQGDNIFEEQLKSEQLKLEQISNEISVLEKNNALLDTTLEELINAQHQSQNILFSQNLLSKITNEIHLINQEVEKIPDNINKLHSELQNTSKDLKIKQLQKENQLIYTSLEQYRNQLTSGKPCPLCGSEHHPYAHKKQLYSDTLSEEIEQLEQNYKIIQNQYDTLVTQLKLQQKSKKEKLFEQHKLEALIQEQTRTFKEHFSLNINSDWERLISENKALTEFNKQKETSQKNIELLNKIHPKIHEIRTIAKQGIDIRTKINYTIGNISFKEIETIIGKWKAEGRDIEIQSDRLQSQHQDTLSQLHNLTSEFSEFSSTLKQHLPSEDILLYYNQLLPYSEVQTLTSQKEKWDQQHKQYHALIQEQQRRIKHLLSKQEKTPLDQLESQIHQLKQRQKQFKQEQEHLQLLYTQQQQCLQEIEQTKQHIEQLQQKSRVWRIMKELIGDSKGNNFNKFAQDLTLVQLLSLANLRLKKLHPRYLLIKPENESKSDDLMVIDQQLGGYRRSVKTLSGGETFIVSLALALALSDLASQNVRIDHLFIDEGFGTLDAETLDQTINTLERLQEEDDKTIGVISHIETLKERIPTQIQVIKNARGYSNIRVVG